MFYWRPIYIAILVSCISVTVISVQPLLCDCVCKLMCVLSCFLLQRNNWRPWTRWRWIDWPAFANYYWGIRIRREWRSAFWAPSDVCQVLYQQIYYLCFMFYQHEITSAFFLRSMTIIIPQTFQAVWYPGEMPCSWAEHNVWYMSMKQKQGAQSAREGQRSCCSHFKLVYCAPRSAVL